MPRTMVRLAVTAALALGSSAALAVPFNSFDPRSMAMGGAGVAVGDAAMAPFFNPALLAVTRDEDDFSMNLPIAGARVYDPDNFQDSYDAFDEGDYVNKLDTAITDFNNVKNSTNLRTVASDSSILSTQLTTLDNKPVQAEAGAALVIGIPSKKYGGALYANGWAALDGIAHYRDDATLQELTTTLNAVADCYDANAAVPGSCNPNTIPNYSTYFDTASGDVTFDSSNLESTVNMRAVGLGEMGFALATQFGEGPGSWAIGLTPKYVKVRLYDIEMDAKTADNGDIDENDYLAEYSHTNFDIGLAKNYNNGWRSGFVVKNVLSHTYAFKNVPRDPVTGLPIAGAEAVATGNSVTLKPQARLGLSHQNGWSTVALDVDLTANDPVGIEKKSRYIALGGELNGWDWVQLRAGYRINTYDSARNVASVGLGLAIAGTLHIDAAVAGNSNEVGGALQLGLQF